MRPRLLLLALASGLLGWPAELCTLGGRVVDKQTGEPLRKVDLSLAASSGRDRKSYAARSNAGGEFRFEGVAPGSYRLTGGRVGYIQQQFNPRGVSSSGTTLKLRDGQRLTDLVFKLTRQAVIVGRTLDEDGDPLPRVAVMLLARRYTEGRRQLAPSRNSHSNDIGEFRLSQIKPGRYYLMAVHYRNRGQANDGTAYVETFYPQGREWTGASPIRITAGQQLSGFDLRLRRAPVFRVRGVVMDGATNAPVEGAVLALTPQPGSMVSPAQRRSVTSGRDGSFEMQGVAPGSYAIFTRGSRRRGRSRQKGPQQVAWQPLVVGEGDADNVIVTLRPPMEVSGQVKVVEGEATSLKGLRVGLFDRNGSRNRRSLTGVEEDGTFKVANLAPGRYSLALYNLPQGTYPKSATYGDEEVLGRVVDLTAGVAGPIAVSLSTNGAQVAGIVTDADDQPTGGVLVTLVPESEEPLPSFYHRSARTELDGTFRMTGIAPGDYRLFAWEDIEAGAERDPQFVEQFTDFAAELSVDEGESETVRLGLIPLAAVADKL